MEYDDNLKRPEQGRNKEESIELREGIKRDHQLFDENANKDAAIRQRSDGAWHIFRG